MQLRHSNNSNCTEDSQDCNVDACPTTTTPPPWQMPEHWIIAIGCSLGFLLPLIAYLIYRKVHRHMVRKRLERKISEIEESIDTKITQNTPLMKGISPEPAEPLTQPEDEDDLQDGAVDDSVAPDNIKDVPEWLGLQSVLIQEAPDTKISTMSWLPAMQSAADHHEPNNLNGATGTRAAPTGLCGLGLCRAASEKCGPSKPSIPPISQSGKGHINNRPAAQSAAGHHNEGGSAGVIPDAFRPAAN